MKYYFIIKENGRGERERDDNQKERKEGPLEKISSSRAKNNFNK